MTCMFPDKRKMQSVVVAVYPAAYYKTAGYTAISGHDGMKGLI